MISKILIILKSGGFKELKKYLFTRVKKFIYYKSETAFLYLSDTTNLVLNKRDDIELRIFTKKEDIDNLNFPRLKGLKYDDWISKGSSVVVAFSADKPISYSWCHLDYYVVKDLIKIRLASDQIWIGPTFVHKSFRGRGVNKYQILFQISNSPANIKCYLTSVNVNNIGSLNSFKNLGFKTGPVIVKVHGVRSALEIHNNNSEIFEFE